MTENKRLTVIMDSREQKFRLKQVALEQNVSMSHIIKKLVDEYLDKHSKISNVVFPP